VIAFVYHERLTKEIEKFAQKHQTVQAGFAAFELLCQTQFNPENPKQIIAPSKLHRVNQGGVTTLWKVELVLPKSGLRPNQFPRVWFAVEGSTIAFLCIATHVDNYDDNTMNNVALARMSDLF